MNFFLGASLILTLAQASVVTPSLEVRPSTANVSIGEPFQVTIEARGPGGTTYEFPKEVSTGAVELHQSKTAPGSSAVAIYDAQIFALGEDGRIPEIEVQFKSPDGGTGSVRSVPLPINIISSLDPKDTNPTPADFAPPMPVLVSKAFWVASTTAGILLVTGLAFLIRRLKFPKKPKDTTITPAVSPEEEALTGLEQLAGRRLTLEPKAFYIQLTLILKQYLERRIGAPVLEMTSTETLAFVKAQSWTSPHAAGVRDLVTSADLAKFGGSTDATNADKQIQTVRDLVARVDRLRRVEVEMLARDQERRRSA